MKFRLLFFALNVCLIGGHLHAAPGDLDALDVDISGNGAYVDATALQPDGKIVIGGHFDAVLGIPRHDIARLNADGTLDLEFDPTPRLGGNPDFDYVLNVTVQPDGKIIISGSFDQLQPNGAPNPTTRFYLARVNGDGTLDVTFDPNPNGLVDAVLVQSDGKILLAGNFTALQPTGEPSPISRSRIARLNPDGTLDMGFDPRASDTVNSVTMQADGKLVIGGSFTTLQPNGALMPITRRRLARLNVSGTLDPTFDPNANGIVDCVALQADGKILVGGNFTNLQPNGAPTPTTRNRIARVNADGSLDSGFNPSANNRVKSMVVQADGKILLGGFFDTLHFNMGSPISRRFIARLDNDGTVEPDFDPKADAEVFSVSLQTDGRVLPGGAFFSLQPNGAPNGTLRRYFARLQNVPATQTLSRPDPTQILWERGGSAPEFCRTTFELSTNGGSSWSLLGDGQRIGTTANWQLLGLNLPANGLVRARGVAQGGYLNGSAGLFEQMAGFGPDSDNDGLLDSWELMFYPTVLGHGALDDFDQDDLSELLEEAFGLNPTVADAASMPHPVIESSYLTITITKHDGVSYEVQTAGTLAAGQADSFSGNSTTVLIDTATMLKVRDNFLIGTAPRRLMRVQVTAAP